MNTDKATNVRISCAIIFLLLMGVWIGLSLPKDPKPVTPSMICHSRTQHNCLWVDGTSTWKN